MSGPKPSVNKGTRVILPVTDQKEFTCDGNRWDVKVYQQDGNTVTFQVRHHTTISYNKSIGKCRK